MKQYVSQKIFVLVCIIGLLFIVSCFVWLWLYEENKLAVISERVNALEAKDQTLQVAKQRRRELSPAWLRAKLEQLESDLEKKDYDSKFAEIHVELQNNSIGIKENRVLHSIISKQLARQKGQLSKINRSIEDLQIDTKNIRAIVLEHTKTFTKIQKEMARLQEDRSKIKEKLTTLYQEFENLKSTATKTVRLHTTTIMLSCLLFYFSV